MNDSIILVVLALAFGASAVAGVVQFGRGIRAAAIPMMGIWFAALLIAARFRPMP